MGQLNLCTYNLEWMTSFFGAGKDADWLANRVIPASFPGKDAGGIKLAPIADIHGLCTRIAAGIRTVDPDVLFIEEGPPLQEQMALFVSTFLNDDYVSYRSNRADQAIHVLVRRSLENAIKPWLPTGATVQQLWRNVPYYPWGKIAAGRDRPTQAHQR